MLHCNRKVRSREFSTLLLMDIEEEMQCLMASLQSQDRPAVKQAAHTLKGLYSHIRDSLPNGMAIRLQTGVQSAAFPELQKTSDILPGIMKWIIARKQRQEGL